MAELIDLFRKLSEFFDRNLLWQNVEEIYEKTIQDKCAATPADEHNSKCDDEPLAKMKKKLQKTIENIPFVQRALEDPVVLSTLLELSTAIRTLRGEASKSYDNTYDCWDEVVKVSPRDSYLSFIYALSALAAIDSSSYTYTRLSLAAVNTYFLSLTIPGAKGFHIFEPEVIAHCLQIFGLVERIQEPAVSPGMSRQQCVEISVCFSTFSDDLKQLLRYVHFNDQKETLDALLKKLIDIQYLNYERGFSNSYASNLHVKCFELLDEIINAQNGEPEETLMKLMNMTIFLHTYTPKPKCTNTSVTIVGDCEHISDWFIKCFTKYPRLLVKILNFYIECVVTNPVRSWKAEQIQRSLDYAAKYDAALFTKCNESNVQFLSDAIVAEEVMIRSRAIELISRILQLESHVDWHQFTDEISDIPREVHFIKELIDRLQDINNNVKLKAVQALQAGLTKGSKNTVKIITEGVQYTQFCDLGVMLPEEPRLRKNEVRYEKPAAIVPKYTFKGHELIELSFLHLPEYIYAHLYRNPVSYIRRAGIMFMEHLVKLNPLIIFKTKFVEETALLVHEPTALVRKQTLLSIDDVLSHYPNCFPVIWAWCKILAPMLNDADPKNIEVAMDCFRSRVLLNMKGIDESNKAEHFMPWVIIRTMLSTQPRLYIQNCFHLALQQRMINQKMLSIIESHLLTSNSTEAWIVLNFVSGKIKSKEPDVLIHHFTSLNSWNKEQNMLIALEVLMNCIQDFSHTALNYAFNYILNQLREGRVIPVLINKTFNFLMDIDNCSYMQKTKKDKSSKTQSPIRNEAWLLELHNLLESRILTNFVDFPSNHSIFMSHLYSYSEVNLHTRFRPHPHVIAFIHKYVSECVKLPESELHLENERLFNSMILISARLSLRDSNVANTTCALYSNILQFIDRPSIVNTIIVSLTDLCKKHTQIVEHIIERVLAKLFSPYVINRVITFECFENLVLQDQLKLRGSLLLALMSIILDENAALAVRACNFFDEFLKKKNATLFQKCLVECPFVFNEYKNFDGLDSFTDTLIKSPLKGENKRKSRQQLYNHLIAAVDDINLVLYFGHLKVLTEKSKNDPTIKCEDGISVVKDVLFILKRVCEVTKEEKPIADDTVEGEKTDDLIEETANEMEDTSTKNKKTAVGGRGRGRRREVVTMADALVLLEKSLIFIPTLSERLNAVADENLQKAFDKLGFALAKRFPNLIEYAQPAEFWRRFRKPINTTTVERKKKSKKRKSRENADSPQIENNVGSDAEQLDASSPLFSSGESDACADDLPLASIQNHSTKAKRSRLNTNNAELPLEYLFNSNVYHM